MQVRLGFAAAMADRADWKPPLASSVTWPWPPVPSCVAGIRSSGSPRFVRPNRRPLPPAQRDERTLTAGQPIPEMGQWVKDLVAGHRAFAQRLAERQSLMVPSEDPGYGDLGQAFPPWPAPARGAILQPPKPEIRPSPEVLQRAAERDADREAAD
ncbi:MAG TPA: hypothetical protein VFW50_15845 [Streptosporangiaceae bacterium]|nr:hypothetical protein [Streptosporangiaceae bacterium]